jgi:hypothetical protein
MTPLPDASRSVPVQVMVRGPLDLVDEPACPGCGKPLERHQPDLDRTESMLGTCLGCGDWFVLVQDTERNQMWITHLPLGHLRSGVEPVGEARAGGAKPAKGGRRKPRSELRAG